MSMHDYVMINYSYCSVKKMCHFFKQTIMSDWQVHGNFSSYSILMNFSLTHSLDDTTGTDKVALWCGRHCSGIGKQT